MLFNCLTAFFKNTALPFLILTIINPWLCFCLLPYMVMSQSLILSLSTFWKYVSKESKKCLHLEKKIIMHSVRKQWLFSSKFVLKYCDCNVCNFTFSLRLSFCLSLQENTSNAGVYSHFLSVFVYSTSPCSCHVFPSTP